MPPNTQVIISQRELVEVDAGSEAVQLKEESPKDASQSATEESSISTPPSPTIVQIDPAKEAAKKDAEQRNKTDRAKGWYDYEFLFYSPSYTFLNAYPNVLRKMVSEDLAHLNPTYNNDGGSRWATVPSTTASGDTRSVVLLRIPPSAYGRTPNVMGFDNSVKQSDAVVLTPSRLQASEQLKILKDALLREPYEYDDDYRYQNQRPLPKWQEEKRKPVIFLLSSKDHNQKDSTNLSQKDRKKEVKDLQKQGEDVLLIEADFDNCKELKDALAQILDYVRSNRGILASVPAAAQPPPRKFSRLNFLSRSSTKKDTAAKPATTAPETTSRSRLFSWKLSSFFSSKD